MEILNEEFVCFDFWDTHKLEGHPIVLAARDEGTQPKGSYDQGLSCAIASSADYLCYGAISGYNVL